MLGVYDNSLTLGGPIVRDKLWYTFTSSLVTLRQNRLGSYNIDGTRVLESNRMRNVQGKFSWQAAQASQLHFMFNFNEKRVYFRPQNTGPSSHFIESNAMTSQRISSPLYQTKWTSALRGNTLLEASASLLTGEEHGRPVPGVQPGDLPTFDAVRLEHRGAVPSYLNRPATRVHVLSGLTFLAGAHDIKVGYQVQWRKHGDTHFSFISPYGFNGVQNGIRAVFRDGVPDSVNTYNTPTTFEMFARDHAAYIQDRWRPTRKLTLNLGLRLEKLHAWQPAVCQEETLFIAAECFPAINGAPDFFAPSPRFGLIYDFAGDGRTALKVTVNRYNQPIGVSYIRSYLNPVRRTNDTRTWDDANGDMFPQLDELGPSTGFNLGTTNRFADDLRWPAATEYSVGFEHQLPGELVFGATYIHRRRTNEIGSRNAAVPASSYTPIDVTEAVTGRQLTVYNLDPALRGVFDVVYGNEPEHDVVFNGVDVTFNKRMSNRWMLMGGPESRRHGGGHLRRARRSEQSQLPVQARGDHVRHSRVVQGVRALRAAVSASAQRQRPALHRLSRADHGQGERQHRRAHPGGADADGGSSRDDAPGERQHGRHQPAAGLRERPVSVHSGARRLQPVQQRRHRGARDDAGIGLPACARHSAGPSHQVRRQRGFLKPEAEGKTLPLLSLRGGGGGAVLRGSMGMAVRRA